ncbi:MAG: S41 family peptidase [Thermoguttaceae bacterium]
MSSVMGERTWGKGSVQSVIEMEGGKSALKLTTAAYFRPSGKNIHRFPDSRPEDDWGVEPDKGFALKLDVKELVELIRYRQKRDILRVEQKGKNPSGFNDNQQPQREFVDRQLQMAVKYLSDVLAKRKKTAP